MQRFELTVLGCGSATPTNKRNPSAQVLNIAERFFLIDCGEGTQLQLRKAGISFRKIDQIFISHLHGDHYFGLIGLLQSFHLLGRQKKLTVYGPAPLKEVIELQNRVSQTDLVYELEFVATDAKKTSLIYEDLKVEVFAFPLYHKIACTGFLFREKVQPRKIIKEELEKRNISIAEIHRLKAGEDATDEDGNVVLNEDITEDPPRIRSFAYCSDTRFDTRVAESVKGVDLLYHESTFLDDLKDRAELTMHSTAREAAEVARLAGAQKLILGHFSSRYEDETPFLSEASEIFPHTLLAIEGKVFQL